MAGWLALWWVWLCAALALGVVELVLPGSIFLGFALGALAMALVVAFWAPGNVALLLALFAVRSLGWCCVCCSNASPAGRGSSPATLTTVNGAQIDRVQSRFTSPRGLELRKPPLHCAIHAVDCLTPTRFRVCVSSSRGSICAGTGAFSGRGRRASARRMVRNH